MKKVYNVAISIAQILPGINTRQMISFNFGDEIFEARQFAQLAEKALDKEGKPYKVELYEGVDYYED